MWTVPMLRPSRRASSAGEAVIERILATYMRPGVINLAPGVAHWAPPATLQAEALRGGSDYGDCRGEQALRDALHTKLSVENGHAMASRGVMVTPGANQAFAHTMLALCDPGDEAILFRPYYFSHLVALQLLGVKPVFVDSDVRTGLPDLDGVRAALRRPGARVRAAVLVSPSNPSGAVSPALHVSALRKDCAAAGAWLVSDEAYEHFVYGAAQHTSAAAALDPGEDGEGVVTLHTFSKSYGLAAWRVGYISYPSLLHEPLLTVQDTLPTHACRASQRLAVAALTHLGTPWVEQQVEGLEPVRRLLWEALEPLNASTDTPQPDGAFYFWLPLPAHFADDDEAAVRWLAEEHGLLMLPGSAFGRPGFLRLAYGTLASAQEAAPVAERLARVAAIWSR